MERHSIRVSLLFFYEFVKSDYLCINKRNSMTGQTVYEALLDYLRADKRGMAVSITEFNRLSVIVNRRLLADLAKKFEEGIDLSSSIGAFKKLDQALTITAGKSSLPSDYYQLIGEPYYTDTTSIVRNLDVVTALEHSKRERDYLTKSTLKHPTCQIGSEDSSGNLEIRVYPTTGISTIYIDYIREPNTPYLDYYMNEDTLEVTYLAEGTTNFTIPTGYVYRDGTTGIKNSLTYDWEWSEDELPVIVAYFMQLLGVALPDELVIQAGMVDKKEINE